MVVITALTIESSATIPAPWTCRAAAIASTALIYKLYQHNKTIACYLDKVFAPFSVALEGMTLKNFILKKDETYEMRIDIDRRTLYNADMNSSNTKVQNLITELNESKSTWDKIMSFVPTALSGTSNHFENETTFNGTLIEEGNTYLSIYIYYNNVSILNQTIVNNKIQVVFTTTETITQNFTFDVNYDDGEFQLTSTFNASLQLPPNTITDPRDGEVYATVTIGSQTWMAENLRYNASGSWLNLANLSSSYGRLYNWVTVMNGSLASSSSPSGVQGVCPSGWHVPSDNEWNTLGMALGMPSSGTTASGDWRGTHATGMKSIIGWSNNGNGTNFSGFNVFPAGLYYSGNSGIFSSLGEFAYFWSSTEYAPVFVWYRLLYSSYPSVNRYSRSKDEYGFSCRCVKN